jgi:tRNA-splicing ligase RtcB
MKKLSPRLISWASILDEKTIEQARTASTMPFIYPHLALMPDAAWASGLRSGRSFPRWGRSSPRLSESISAAA